jgi:translation initiation factor IF-2
MSKKRVYEIAKDLGVSSKELIEKLILLDCDVKNHMSVVPDDIAETIVNQIKTEKMKLAFDETAATPEEVEKREAQELERLKIEEEELFKAEQLAIEEKTYYIGEFTTVKELCEIFNAKRNDIVTSLMKLGIMNITQKVDFDVASLIGQELGYIVKLKESGAQEMNLLETEDNTENLKVRPPVITVMGHVDHGKTSLLDRIRNTSVTSGEAGGITQHIGAYQVVLKDGQKLTFLDTPGHAAFTAMRAHGAAITDIAILVVAADDGVMPQTIEAIDHANAAEVPMIVAINKIDKAGANIDKVKKELAQHGVAPEDWGGDIVCVPLSAITGEGVSDLLDMIHLVAEMREIKADPDRSAVGVVIEARRDKGLGAIATVLIQKGTVKKGDSFICGPTSGKIRQLIDYTGKKIKSAPPSTPVVITGFSDIPEAGEKFYVVVNEKIARQHAEQRRISDRDKSMLQSSRTGIKLEDLFKSETKELSVIVKADVKGSIVAVKDSLEQLSTEEVTVRVIRAAAGAPNENDVMLAVASNAVIIGFNVRASGDTLSVAEKEKVEIRYYDVIYNIHDDIRKAIVGMLDPVFEEVVLARADVRNTFKVPKIGSIAGCYIVEGTVIRNKKARILRDGIIIYTGKINSLRRFKDDVTEVKFGYECGIGVEKFNDIKVGDVIEVFESKEVEQDYTDLIKS